MRDWKGLERSTGKQKRECCKMVPVELYKTGPRGTGGELRCRKKIACRTPSGFCPRSETRSRGTVTIPIPRGLGQGRGGSPLSLLKELGAGSAGSGWGKL